MWSCFLYCTVQYSGVGAGKKKWRTGESESAATWHESGMNVSAHVQVEHRPLRYSKIDHSLNHPADLSTATAPVPASPFAALAFLLECGPTAWTEAQESYRTDDALLPTRAY